MRLLRFFRLKSKKSLSQQLNTETQSDDQVCNVAEESTESSSSSFDRNDEPSPNKRLVHFSLSCSSSSSLNEIDLRSFNMSTRIIPVGLYREQDQASSSTSSSSSSGASSASTNTDEKNSSASLIKRVNAYRPFESASSQFSSNGSNTSSSSSSSSSSLPIRREMTSLNRTSTNPTTSNMSAGAMQSSRSHLLTMDNLTIEQNLFNMVRFDVVKSNFCDFYQLGDYVRSGGFSDIHEGIRLSDNKSVVVKFIPKEKTKNWLMISQKKYPAEVLLHKAVHEIQGVIHVYDYFENADNWVLVMERLRNCKDLFDFLESKETGRLNEATARKFFKQLVQINLAMLRKGVVHRDLKSENILVDLDTESLILIDFGASAIYKSSSTYYSDFHGTKQYKSPEYILKKRYSGVPSTVWTLGVLLYDMVCGCLPFETEEEITGYKLVLKPHLSSELKNLIQRCLAQNPDRRPSLESLLEHAWLKG